MFMPSPSSHKSTAGDGETEPILRSDGTPSDSDDRHAAVVTRNLCKTYYGYDGSAHVALDGVSVSFPRNRVTAVLGQNGAGKTTLMSILAGLQAPTDGDATVAGASVRTQASAILARVGVCPQFDVLWPMMTVAEHLDLFAAVKGYCSCDWGALPARRRRHRDGGGHAPDACVCVCGLRLQCAECC